MMKQACTIFTRPLYARYLPAISFLVRIFPGELHFLFTLPGSVHALPRSQLSQAWGSGRVGRVLSREQESGDAYVSVLGWSDSFYDFGKPPS